MNKYLIEILQIQSSVILPGLGALMVPSQKSGKIVFNPHLKFNDGSLAKFIAEKEGIDKQEAQNKVAKFVREIEAELGKGNTYDMFEFGKFYKNKEGEVNFEMFAKDGGNAADKVEKKAEKPKPAEKKPVVTPADILKAEKTEADKKKTEKKTAKKDEVKPAATEPPKSEKTTNTFVPSEDQKEEPVKGAPKAEKKEAPKKEETSAKVAPPKVVKPTKSEDKQAKNTFVPKEEKKTTEAPKKEDKPAKEDKKIIAPITATSSPKAKTESKTTTDKSKAKVAAAGTAATKVAQKANKETTKVVEKTKESVIVKEEEKKRSKLPLILLLLLLIGLAAGGYFFKDQIMGWFDNGHELAENADDHSEDPTGDDSANSEEEHSPATHEMEADSTVNVEDVVPADGEMTEDPVEEEVSEPIEETPAPVVSGSNNGSYHLIGNSFGERANADRYVKSMESKGYPAKVLGQFDGLYLVSLKSYDSRADAQAGRSSVTGDASSAWIFKYPK